MILFSGSTLGFYNSQFNTAIPDDAVEITNDQWSEFSGQAPISKELYSVNSMPAWKDTDKTPLTTEYNVGQAKLILSTALAEDIESGGYTWQVRNQIDLQNIQDAIDQHDYENLSDDETQSFRMSDNVWHDVKVDEFKKVLSDYRMRKKDIYAAFKAWTETDMLEAFTI